MIVSASRRTDIPAFYGEWFMNRLKAGFALVRNPRNPRRISRVPLSREVVDCMVFWTKNPAPMLERLAEVERLGYPFYVQYTITAYGGDVETRLPPKERLLETFRRLADMVGPDRVVWRYDPVVLNRDYPAERHAEIFDAMAGTLAGYTRQCVFSFVDMYRRNRNSMRGVMDGNMTEDAMRALSATLSALAGPRGMSLSACTEDVDLSGCGVSRAACIDRALIERILGLPLRASKDPSQRKSCGCVESVDIGEYDSCPYGCRYCYATSDARKVAVNVRRHDPESDVLLGYPGEGDVITERQGRSCVVRQGFLLG